MSSEESDAQNEAIEPSVPPETLDFLFEYTREAPQRQLAAMNALDTKAFALFSAGAVVLGLAGLGAWGGREQPLGAGVLLACAVVAFLLVGLAVFDSVRLRRYRSVSHAGMLWRTYWRDPVADI